MSDEATTAGAATEATTATQAAASGEVDTRAAALALLNAGEEQTEETTEAAPEKPVEKAAEPEVKKPNRVFESLTKKKEKLNRREAELVAREANVSELNELRSKVEAMKGDPEKALALLDAWGIDLAELGKRKLEGDSPDKKLSDLEKRVAAKEKADADAAEKAKTEASAAALRAEKTEAEATVVREVRAQKDRYPSVCLFNDATIAEGANIAVTVLRRELGRHPTWTELYERLERNGKAHLDDLDAKRGNAKPPPEATVSKKPSVTLSNSATTASSPPREQTDADRRATALKMLEEMFPD